MMTAYHSPLSVRLSVCLSVCLWCFHLRPYFSRYVVDKFCGCVQGMEALQACGKAKSIGVSNFNVLQLERLLDLARVPPAVNQVHTVTCSCLSRSSSSVYVADSNEVSG